MLFLNLLGCAIWAIGAAVIRDSADTIATASTEQETTTPSWDEQSLLATAPAICTKADYTDFPTEVELDSFNFGDMKPPRRGGPPNQDVRTDRPLGDISKYKWYAQKEAAMHFKCPYAGEDVRYMWWTAGWKNDQTNNGLGSIGFQDLKFAAIYNINFFWSRPEIQLWRQKIERKWCKPQWRGNNRYQCKYTMQGILFGSANIHHFQAVISQTITSWNPSFTPHVYEECIRTCQHHNDPTGAWYACAGAREEVLACKINNIDDRTVRTNAPTRDPPMEA